MNWCRQWMSSERADWNKVVPWVYLLRSFLQSYNGKQQYTAYPDVDYFINVCFKKQNKLKQGVVSEFFTLQTSFTTDVWYSIRKNVYRPCSWLWILILNCISRCTERLRAPLKTNASKKNLATCWIHIATQMEQSEISRWRPCYFVFPHKTKSTWSSAIENVEFVIVFERSRVLAAPWITRASVFQSACPTIVPTCC